MYFIRTKKAINDLQNERINEKETLKYLFGLGVLSSFGLPRLGVFAERDLGLLGIDDIFLGIAALVALFFVIKKCFRLNSQSDRNQFFKRFLVLDFIISLKVTLVYVVIYLLIGGINIVILVPKIRANPTEELALTAWKLYMIGELIIKPILGLTLLVIWYTQLLTSFRRLNEGIQQKLYVPELTIK
ncbi:MAG: hypothetical protein ACYS6I_00660 [Planctomycetota bacterium]|jgi:putative flippase GtrA